MFVHNHIQLLQGSYSLPTRVNCVACGMGKYQPETGQGKCELCPLGRYTDKVGQSECKICQQVSWMFGLMRQCVL